jgi:hypothetical protein
VRRGHKLSHDFFLDAFDSEVVLVLLRRVQQKLLERLNKTNPN